MLVYIQEGTQEANLSNKSWELSGNCDETSMGVIAIRWRMSTIYNRSIF